MNSRAHVTQGAGKDNSHARFPHKNNWKSGDDGTRFLSTVCLLVVGQDFGSISIVNNLERRQAEQSLIVVESFKSR